MNEVCPYCAVAYSKNSKFCTQCGRPRAFDSASDKPNVFCHKCHAVVPMDMKFCRMCGEPLVQDASGASAAEKKGAKSFVDLTLPLLERPVPGAERLGKLKTLRAGGIAALCLIAVLVLYFIFRALFSASDAAVSVSEEAQTANAPTVSAEHSSSGETAAEEFPGQDAGGTQADSAVQDAFGAQKPAGAAKPLTAGISRSEKTCDQVSGLGPSFLCKSEGAERFWKCAPDGENWNPALPGCRRGSAVDRTRPY
ncbi:MAG: zinc ribbon domain-containing protein [Zoogloeaceae bacterium]|jgi:RNA polymerase subunit RPABC4/transcription elongation factor Spt4|nr:zinc ribbon domain-containing protein [Zoogloeaceae bacterium]